LGTAQADIQPTSPNLRQSRLIRICVHDHKNLQIDGSFELNSQVYLLEAKWHSKQISQDALLIFREKVENKSQWSRGLLMSISGFTADGLAAFARGRATNIIGMTGQDLYFILSGEISLADAIAKKVRRAAETGEFHVPVYDLLRA
jgi:hypothetical protein